MSNPDKEWFRDWFDSPYYPVLYQHRNGLEALPFIKHIVEHFDLQAGDKVLDLACGRGRHARILAQFDLDVYGFDLSPESIRSAIGFPGNKVKYRVHDMRSPFPVLDFRLIVNLFTSFGYFENLQENQTVITNVRNALSPDGIFLLDYLNINYIRKALVPEETKVINGIQFDLRKEILNDRIIKEIQINDQGKTYTYHEDVQALTLDGIQSMCANSGLEVFGIWGDYEGNAFDFGESPRLVLLAKIAD